MRKIASFLLMCISLWADQGTWNSSAPIPSSSVTTGPIFCLDIPASPNQFVAVWNDTGSSSIVSSFYTNGSWSSSPLLVNASNLNTLYPIISLCYKTGSNELLAAWSDNTGTGHFCTYNGISWSETFNPALIAGAINLCYFPTINKVVAAWVGAGSLPLYSVYSSGSWSPAAPIIAGGPFTGSIALSYNPSVNKIVAVWIAPGGTGTVAAFDGTTWAQLAPLTAPVASSDFSMVFDVNTNRTIAIWADAGSIPNYATYDGTWTTLGAITGAPQTVRPMQLCSNPSNGNLLVSIVDKVTSLPWYALYIGGWVGAGQIPGSSAVNSAPFSQISLTLDTNTQEFLASWKDNATSLPYYSIYAMSSWKAAPAQIAAAPTSSFPVVPITYDSTAQSTLALWSNVPSYAVYSSSGPTPPTPSPVSSFAGEQKNNNFGLVTELYNALTWGPSPSTTIVAYQIYRNGTLIATVPATELSYNDNNQKKQTVTYSIVAIDNVGASSSSTSITIR